MGLTRVVSTYSRLKDILIGPIPAPSAEPDLNKYIGLVAFGHFLDDNSGGSKEFNDLLEWLHL